MLRTPILIVNCKAYPQGIGIHAVEIASACDKVRQELGVEIAIAVQAPDIYRIVEKFPKLPVLAQHIDPYPMGSYTGWLVAEAVKAAGAIGTLLNHSEHRLPLDTLDAAIQRCRKAGLLTVVCADTPDTARDIAKLSPDMIAIEPPELIGTGIPVSKAKPEVVKNGVMAVQQINSNIPVLCGAGITRGDDVSAALQLGARGVLVASGVVKAKDVLAAVRDLAVPLKEI